LRLEGILFRILWMLLSISFVSCGSDSQKYEFETIEKGFHSGIILDSPRIYKIDNQPDWDDFWADHKSIIDPDSEQPEVDFSNYDVIAVIDKEEPTGGFMMEIKAVEEHNGKLNVRITKTEPGPDCVVTQALTQPFHIIRTGKSSLQPRMVLTTRISDC
jgi:hypothetical protein